MLMFAEVEGELNMLLDDMCSSKEFDSALKEQFKERVRIARKNIDLSVTNKDIAKSINKSLDKLVNLAENVRNLIAHNPLELSLESLFEEKEYLEIRSHRRSHKFVKLNDLEKHAEDLSDSLSQFKEDCYRISCLLHP